MLKKKCPSCEEKIDKKFSFCPYCGGIIDSKKEEDFGMLGKNDFEGEVGEDLKLPFGLNKIMNSLIGQLEKQMEGMNFEDMNNMFGPKGIKIKVARGPVKMNPGAKPVKKTPIHISEEEKARRAGLERVDAGSRIKRLGDVIVYEIEAPGVMKKEDVVVSELETGIEVKAYARDKCYVKVIPLKVEIIGMRIDREKVSVELKG